VLSAYLPVMLMGLLALGTWWLVKNSPSSDEEPAPAAARHEPDYTMTAFSVQRFNAAGEVKARIEGDRLRHYPDTDTLEIDNVRIRAVAADGRVTLASATRALSNGDGSEVQLLGGAHVVREAADAALAIHFRGEFLHAFFDTERVRSHLPVTVTRGATELRAESMEYDHLSGLVRLNGRMRGVFEARRQRP
jgi:lipopolysaccharide export system protein LptC